MSLTDIQNSRILGWIAEDADLRAFVRRLTGERGEMASRVSADKKGAVTKFEMYYDYREPLKDIPSHRMLAMRRGEKEEVLFLAVEAPVEEILAGLKAKFVSGRSIFGQFLEGAVHDAYKRLMAPSIEVELRLEAKQKADDGAIKVFADNLRNLLLAPPAAGKLVLGIDPGLQPDASWRQWMKRAACRAMASSTPIPARPRRRLPGRNCPGSRRRTTAPWWPWATAPAGGRRSSSCGRSCRRPDQRCRLSW